MASAAGLYPNDELQNAIGQMSIDMKVAIYSALKEIKTLKKFKVMILIVGLGEHYEFMKSVFKEDRQDLFTERIFLDIVRIYSQSTFGIKSFKETCGGAPGVWVFHTMMVAAGNMGPPVGEKFLKNIKVYSKAYEKACEERVFAKYVTAFKYFAALQNLEDDEPAKKR